MKTLLTILLMAATLVASAQTVHTFTAAANNGEIYRASLPGVMPGDTIKLRGINGVADIVYLNGIAGTANAPVIITVDDSLQVGVTRTNYAIWLNGRYFKLLGKNMLTIKPSEGDTLATGLSMNGSADYTVKDINIYRCRAGFIQNPETGGLRENITIKGLKFYDLRTTLTGTCEAIYIGSTKLRKLGEHTIVDGGVTKTVNAWFNNILIEDCFGYGLDGDFIQVAMSQNVTIRNCGGFNYGRLNLNSHKVGYLIGGSSTITIDNCIANSGNGPYVQVYGHGQNVIRNCTFTNGAVGASVDDGIFIDKKNDDDITLQLRIENTTIGGARRNAIRNYDATSVLLCNVTMSSNGPNISGDFFNAYSSCDAQPDPPQPIKPAAKPKLIRPGRVIKIRG